IQAIRSSRHSSASTARYSKTVYYRKPVAAAITKARRPVVNAKQRPSAANSAAPANRASITANIQAKKHKQEPPLGVLAGASLFAIPLPNFYYRLSLFYSQPGLIRQHQFSIDDLDALIRVII